MRGYASGGVAASSGWGLAGKPEAFRKGSGKAAKIYWAARCNGGPFCYIFPNVGFHSELSSEIKNKSKIFQGLRL
jgi:hypothetical protein